MDNLSSSAKFWQQLCTLGVNWFLASTTQLIQKIIIKPRQHHSAPRRLSVTLIMLCSMYTLKVVLGSCTLYIRIYIYAYLYIYVYGYITISATAASGTLPGAAPTACAAARRCLGQQHSIGLFVLPLAGSPVMYTMFTAL